MMVGTVLSAAWRFLYEVEPGGGTPHTEVSDEVKCVDGRIRTGL